MTRSTISRAAGPVPSYEFNTMGSLWVQNATLNGPGGGWGNWQAHSTSVVGLNQSLVPAPGAIALLGAAGLVGSRRRRA